MRQLKTRTWPLVLLAGVFAVSGLQAAQLGRVQVLSNSSEPFRAEIAVEAIAPEQRATLKAALASPEAYRAARLEVDPRLSALTFEVVDGTSADTAVVKVSAQQPFEAGFVDALIELTWAGGRVAREYTLSIAQGPAPASSQATTQLPEIRPPVAQAPAVGATAPARQAAPPVSAPPAQTPPRQVASGQQSRRIQAGDTLSELALELVGDGVTLNQAMAALFEANPEAFINGSVHLIRQGAQIRIPDRASIRARSSNDALVILAQADDRNTYSLRARQLGLLDTVAAQATLPAGSPQAQGQITQPPAAAPAADTERDRLQIASGQQGQGRAADARDEELIAKNKALQEANERIALLEQNVGDLQKLLELQGQGLGQPAAEPAQPSVAAETEVGSTEGAAPAVEVEAPSAAVLPETEPPTTDESPAEPAVVDADQAEPGLSSEEAAFNWLPWVLAGAGGLALIVVLLLVARARREASANKGAQDEPDFSDVQPYDDVEVQPTVTGAAAQIVASEPEDKGLSKTIDDAFDLEEILEEPPQDTRSAKQDIEPVDLTADVPDEPEKLDEPAPESEMPEELTKGPEHQSLNDPVELDFPDDEVTQIAPAKADEVGGGIFDDLDSLEKGAALAQQELDALRSNPAQDLTPEDDEPLDDDSAADDDAEQQASKDRIAALEREMAELDLDVDPSPPAAKVDDATWQEVATKLDLAGAYVEIGDADGARELLDEIVKKGDAEQVRKAKALLAGLR